MKLSISAEKRSKLSWIGKRVLAGLVIALIGSMLIEMAIYGLAEKIANAYTGQFFQ